MVLNPVLWHHNRAALMILSLVSLGEGLEVAGRLAHVFRLCSDCGIAQEVSLALGALLLTSRCAQMLWRPCGMDSAHCDDVVGLGSCWTVCTIAAKCCRSKTCNVLV